MGIVIDHARQPFRELLPNPTEFIGDKGSICHHYKLENVRKTENAWLLFTRNMENNEHTVIKMLREYKDSRYKLAMPADRQRCQIEGLTWNSRFTSDVYLGLARFCSIDKHAKIIGLGEIIKEPEKAPLDAESEYVILMRELPKSRRLDNLLKEGKQFALHYHAHNMELLTQYVVYLHTAFTDFTMLPGVRDKDVGGEDGIEWGSVDQLKKKLYHNLAFVNQTLLANQDEQHRAYFSSLKKTYTLLKDDLLRLFEHSMYLEYFKRRFEEGYIRRCHGDLKGRNIWIDPCEDNSFEAAKKCVKVLDAVDFNPMYSNIDILSDFAMLVVDVQARTESIPLANLMMKRYLELTQQENDAVAKAVLAYYLVEKAFIGGIVNIIYDDLPTLGMSFLQVAEMRMQELKPRISTAPLTPYSR